MYTAADITGRLRVRPFVPVRVTTSAGETFDVYHPDLVLVGRREVIIGQPAADDPEHYDRKAQVSILHITSLKDLPVPAAPSA